MATERWYEALARLQRQGLPHVLATQVTSLGSTPREPGARMVITEDAVYDTLGGGTFEWQVIAAARKNLSEGHTGMQLEAFSLGGRSGQCCGGFVNVILETYPGVEVHVAVFGAGHVGRALAELAAPLEWRMDWFDSRDSAFDDLETAPPRQYRHHLNSPEQAVANLLAGSHALVLTHDHAEDFALIDALLKRSDIGSIGLIGSKSKWASFRRRLLAAGHGDADVARVRCPIGDSGGDKRPYAVALSALAELLPISATQAGSNKLSSDRVGNDKVGSDSAGGDNDGRDVRGEARKERQQRGIPSDKVRSLFD
ncbi:xanthine dehydrogenase accessory protein XdhC [Halomonas binhaiensis]|uniref:Xanthine dehydrogenase accessory protein XdhC n=1 Tax=Halomonas binhaiensis TaxID=2562282 RepID=A0A5C1NFE9_9GAMM|nr:xanthine dehydrogenase accessory protein XdhC [Halomonas binhaiensis]QEM81954.1 xanthine dehydrogenase accessory protein XdhC [Halomonas binhaiensis]